MASKTSWRWTGTSLGATMPRRTLSPRISTTVTVISLLITILSFFFLDSTSIAAYPSWKREACSSELIPTRLATDDKRGLQQNAPVKIPFPCKESGASLGGRHPIHVPKTGDRGATLAPPQPLRME